MLSRRDFLHLGGLALPGLALLSLPPNIALARPNRTGEQLSFGLFFGEEALPILRERFTEAPMFAGVRVRMAAFDRAAERRFLTDEIDYRNTYRHLQRTSTTAQQMAFYYLMTGDEDAAALSRRAVRALMRFPRWDYFMEGGTEVIGIQRASNATLAVSLSADWLGDFVSGEERAAWIRTMGERGCEACFLTLYGMRYPDRVAGWTVDPSSAYFKENPGSLDLSNWPVILDQTNLKAVPASALAVGTMAYQQQFRAGEDTRRWLEQAVYSLRTFRSLFAPDGSYEEGVGYANYATHHVAQAFHALRRCEGIDLYDVINWPGFIHFLQEMTMPTKNRPYAIVNFGDSWSGGSSTVPFWVAGRSHDPRAQWLGRSLADEHSKWSLMWYDPSIAARRPPAEPHLWQSDLDWMVARTGYEAADLVVAMRSGGPANHEHADRNSLIVKCFGEQLVADPHGAPYGHAHPAWIMRTTAGHSALLIDGQGHQYHDGSEGTNASDARAKIIRSGERDGYCFWASDATSAYRLVLPDVQSVTRTVVVFYELPALLVFDKVIKKRTPSQLQARFFGYNGDGGGHVEAGADGFLITRPGAVLRGLAHAPSGVQVRTGLLPIPEEQARRHPFAEVSTQEAQLESFPITVLLPERGEGGQAAAQIDSPSEGTYAITLHNGERTRRCRVFDTGTVPEFAVS